MRISNTIYTISITIMNANMKSLFAYLTTIPSPPGLVHPLFQENYAWVDERLEILYKEEENETIEDITDNDIWSDDDDNSIANSLYNEAIDEILDGYDSDEWYAHFGMSLEEMWL
jgi:hypothetical protein